MDGKRGLERFASDDDTAKKPKKAAVAAVAAKRGKSTDVLPSVVASAKKSKSTDVVPSMMTTKGLHSAVAAKKGQSTEGLPSLTEAQTVQRTGLGRKILVQLGVPLRKATSTPSLGKANSAASPRVLRQQQPDWIKGRVRDQAYFHGFINKDEICSLLVQEGDFILRVGRSKASAHNVTLSVMHAKRPRHFIINRAQNGMVYVEQARMFTDEVEMVEWYRKSITALGLDGILLITPIKRQLWELVSADIVLGNEIGKGAFGKVFSGTLHRGPKLPNVAVAIKLCEALNLTLDAQNVFTKEAEIGRHLIHPNIIKVFGVQHKEEPLMIVMELAGGGNLRKRLQDDAGLSEGQLLVFAREACAALEFLERKRVLHRDVAARNFLLGGAPPQLTVKLADFGLAKSDSIAYKMQARTKLAIKWMAPEVMLSGDFSIASEVWSYGIVLWEILSRGDEPWNGVPVTELKERVTGPDKLRLVCAPKWSPVLVDLMAKMWAEEPKSRPKITAIGVEIERLLTKSPPTGPAKTSSPRIAATPTTANIDEDSDEAPPPPRNVAAPSPKSK